MENLIGDNYTLNAVVSIWYRGEKPISIILRPIGHEDMVDNTDDWFIEIPLDDINNWIDELKNLAYFPKKVP